VIRVFVADDHDIVRTGLKRLLDDLPDMMWCGEAACLEDVFDALSRSPVDVVVMDVNMPGGGGPHAVDRLLGLTPAPRIVVFTMYAEDAHAVAFLRAGAGAFISKRRSSAELIEAIRKVHAGGRHITPELADYLFQQQIDVEKPPAELLSERELEVVRSLARGLRATEVAADFSVSTSTVNTYVQRIKAKLGVRTAVEIVEFARANGLLG
jgi:two-component system invasion response regulator UvrY